MIYKGNSDNLVGIVSYNIHSIHLNYGTALHSYAFQQYLKKKSVDSVILNYKPTGHLDGYNMKYPILNYKGGLDRHKIYKHLRDWGLGFFSNIRKYNKFQKFFAENYVMTQNQYSQAELLAMHNLENLKVRTWVCESDVIWKRYNIKPLDEIFFLHAPFMNECKKVAYAPAMSSRKFTETELEQFRMLTRDFNAISCRERESTEYVSEILGKSIPLVLDPVLLLSPEDYDSIIVEPKIKHYLLVYNCMKNNERMLIESQQLADKLGLQMVEISNFAQNKYKKRFRHKVVTDAGIGEFLGYFKYADFIVCSSFHGCCFSVLFKKEFFVFQRDKSDYKIPSIARELGCLDRLVDCSINKIPQINSKINYIDVYNKLEKLRATSCKYISTYIF